MPGRPEHVLKVIPRMLFAGDAWPKDPPHRKAIITSEETEEIRRRIGLNYSGRLSTEELLKRLLKGSSLACLQTYNLIVHEPPKSKGFWMSAHFLDFTEWIQLRKALFMIWATANDTWWLRITGDTAVEYGISIATSIERQDSTSGLQEAEFNAKAAQELKAKAAQELVARATQHMKSRDAQETKAKAAQNLKVEAAQELRLKVTQDFRTKAAQEMETELARNLNAKAAQELKAKATQELRIKVAQEMQANATQESKTRAHQAFKTSEDILPGKINDGIAQKTELSKPTKNMSDVKEGSQAVATEPLVIKNIVALADDEGFEVVDAVEYADMPLRPKRSWWQIW